MIALDAEVFGEAGRMQTDFGMPAQDAIVLASVVRHLAETKPVESCFLNRNTKDFDDPNVRQMLEEYRCRFFGRFDAGLRYISARIGSA